MCVCMHICICSASSVLRSFECITSIVPFSYLRCMIVTFPARKCIQRNWLPLPFFGNVSYVHVLRDGKFLSWLPSQTWGWPKLYVHCAVVTIGLWGFMLAFTFTVISEMPMLSSPSWFFTVTDDCEIPSYMLPLLLWFPVLVSIAFMVPSMQQVLSGFGSQLLFFCFSSNPLSQPSVLMCLCCSFFRPAFGSFVIYQFFSCKLWEFCSTIYS